MSVYVVDVEADGQTAGLNNMVWFGAVICDKEGKFNQTFEGKMKPIFPAGDKTDEALAVSNLTWDDVQDWPEPVDTMHQFAEWVKETTIGQPMFYADNNGFDFAYINYYLYRYYGSNPFGWSSRNINSLWHGMMKDCYKSFRFLRKTKHTHNPVDDAKGNAEAIYAMYKEYGLKIKLK